MLAGVALAVLAVGVVVGAARLRRVDGGRFGDGALHRLRERYEKDPE